VISTGSRRRLFLVLALVWAGVIFFLSSRPTLPIPSLFPLQDKLEHMVAYGLLGFLVSGARQLRGNPVSFIGTSVVLCGLYGLSDEFHQSFVPGRDADIYDLCADVAGALIGSYVLYQLLNRRWLRAN
jgi:VanZ family protein